MMEERDYRDIPGTYIFDGEHNRKGYGINMFCKSLDIEKNRNDFRKSPLKYMMQFPMSQEQVEAVLNRDWIAMLRLGGNIYYTFKLAIFDGMSMQHIGAAMSETDMTAEGFREMMLRGGRTIKGNRSKKENANG